MRDVITRLINLFNTKPKFDLENFKARLDLYIVAIPDIEIGSKVIVQYLDKRKEGVVVGVRSRRYINFGGQQVYTDSTPVRFIDGKVDAPPTDLIFKIH